MYFITDWARRIDFDAMRADRLRRAHAAMERHNLDALVLFKVENIRYTTNFRGLFWPIIRMSAAAVLSRQSPDPVCLIPPADLEHRLGTMYWLKPENLRGLPPLEDDNLIRKGLPMIVRALEEFGVTRGRIGLDGGNLLVIEALRKALPHAEFVDGDVPMRQARLIKGDQEIAAMRAACECVDVAFDRTIKAVDVGIRECEIMGEAMRAFYSLGMEAWQCSSIVSSGSNLVPMCRFPTDRMVQEGDLVFMDIGGSFIGMYAEITRTVVAGRPNKRQQEIYQAVYAIYHAMLAALKPGVTNEDLAAAADAVYAERGFGEHMNAPFGHSIGVAGWETPLLGPASVIGGIVTFQPGMIISLEPTIEERGVPGGGAVRIEEEVLVTPTGCEQLTHTRHDAKLMGW